MVALRNRQLLKAVEELEPDELQSFVEQVLDVRARKVHPQVSAKERKLFRQVSEQLAPETTKAFDRLNKKRRKGTLTPAELKELIQITDKAEHLAARRAAALAELAKVTKTPVDELMAQLGMA